jgi:AcrR family transcriptional regulator
VPVANLALDAQFAHRDDLIREAFAEFSMHGYDNASINRVLSKIGMSKGQFYYHFADKEGLYLALVELAISRKQEWLRQRPPPDASTLFELLRQQMLASLEFAQADPQIDRFVASLLSERGRPIFDKVIERVGFGTSATLKPLVEAAHARGEFRAGFTPVFIERLLESLMNNLPDILDLREARALRPELDQFVAFLRHGLLSGDETT